MDDDSAIKDEEHFVAAVTMLIDDLADRKRGRAEVRRNNTQALVIKALGGGKREALNVKTQESKPARYY